MITTEEVIYRFTSLGMKIDDCMFLLKAFQKMDIQKIEQLKEIYSENSPVLAEILKAENNFIPQNIDKLKVEAYKSFTSKFKSDTD